jgi:hypothetical protein
MDINYLAAIGGWLLSFGLVFAQATYWWWNREEEDMHQRIWAQIVALDMKVSHNYDAVRGIKEANRKKALEDKVPANIRDLSKDEIVALCNKYL